MPAATRGSTAMSAATKPPRIISESEITVSHGEPSIAELRRTSTPAPAIPVATFSIRRSVIMA